MSSVEEIKAAMAAVSEELENLAGIFQMARAKSEEIERITFTVMDGSDHEVKDQILSFAGECTDTADEMSGQCLVVKEAVDDYYTGL